MDWEVAVDDPPVLEDPELEDTVLEYVLLVTDRALPGDEDWPEVDTTEMLEDTSTLLLVDPTLPMDREALDVELKGAMLDEVY